MDSSGTPGNWISLGSSYYRFVSRGNLTLGFRNAQDGVHDHDNASAAEDQECAVFDLGQHDGCKFRNDEVEQPLSHQGSCHGKGANVVWLCSVSLRYC